MGESNSDKRPQLKKTTLIIAREHHTCPTDHLNSADYAYICTFIRGGSCDGPPSEEDDEGERETGRARLGDTELRLCFFLDDFLCFRSFPRPFPILRPKE